MRWWIYQRERFPVFQNGLLIAAFSSCAITYTALLTDSPVMGKSIAVAFVNCLLFFLQLRIADEFKDAEEDATYRPYRPVPRGLVSLKELGLVFIISMGIQLALSWWLSPKLIILLVITWIYLALMSVEFFARDWLKARPITYLWTHMLIMPLVDLFATACQWIPNSQHPPKGLAWFLAASFFNGIVIETGRKLRQPAAEEKGVPTYSALWGLKRASRVWLGCMSVTALLSVIAASYIGFSVPAALIFVFPIGWALWHTVNYAKTEGKRFEMIAGVWTLTLYLTIGLIPFFLK